VLPAQRAPTAPPPPQLAGTPYQLADGTVIGQCTSAAGDFALVMVQRAHLGVAEQLARS